jgi:hypothetical protein
MKGMRWEQMLRGQGCTSHVTGDMTGDVIGQKGRDGDVTRIAPIGAAMRRDRALRGRRLTGFESLKLRTRSPSDLTGDTCQTRPGGGGMCSLLPSL